MVTLSDFRLDDQRIVEDLLEQCSRQAGCAITIDDLFERWNGFVQELQRGYGHSQTEYEAGLAVRATLVELEDCLSVRGRQILLAGLLQVDRLFLMLTLPTHHALKGSWWRRVPRGRDRAWNGATTSNQSPLGT